MAFKDSVANPEDMILVRRRRDAKPVSKEDYPDVQEALRRGGDDDGCVFERLTHYSWLQWDVFQSAVCNNDFLVRSLKGESLTKRA